MPDAAPKAAPQPAAAASPAPARAPPLPHAPPRRRRRWPRRVGLVLLLAGIAAAGVWQGKPLYRQAQYLAWQRRCLTYTRPADMVVYEEDWTRAGVLLDQPDYGWTYFGPSTHPPPPNVGHMPAVWA